MHTDSLIARLVERCCVASWMVASGAPFLLLVGQWVALTVAAIAAALFTLTLRLPVGDCVHAVVIGRGDAAGGRATRAEAHAGALPRYDRTATVIFGDIFCPNADCLQSPTPRLCQRKVEMSPFVQSRNVPFPPPRIAGPDVRASVGAR